MTGCASLLGCARARPLDEIVPEKPAIDASVDAGSEVADGLDDSLSEADASGDDTDVDDAAVSDGDGASSDDSASPEDAEPDGGGVPSSDDGADDDSLSTDCRPGTYVGSFSGKIGLFGLSLLPISGDLTFAVTTDSTGDNLVIGHGDLAGEDQDGNPVTATIEGTMNCTTNTLEGGVLKDGLYKRLLLNNEVHFAGSIEATYTPSDPPQAEGTWKTASGFESGNGSFKAVWAHE